MDVKVSLQTRDGGWKTHIKMEIKMQHRKYYVGVPGVLETHTERALP